MKARREVYTLQREVVGSLGGILTLVGLFGHADGPFLWVFLVGFILMTYAGVAHRVANRKRNS